MSMLDFVGITLPKAPNRLVFLVVIFVCILFYSNNDTGLGSFDIHVYHLNKNLKLIGRP